MLSLIPQQKARCEPGFRLTGCVDHPQQRLDGDNRVMQPVILPK